MSREAPAPFCEGLGVRFPRATLHGLHWRLDVSLFNEDKCRVYKDNAPENLAVLRHIAMNLHRKDPEKGSMRAKTLRCTMDHDTLLKVLTLK